ncbi:MAG TPA: c-type cytochrome domain-containing protein [Verrucomicrobiae bacterium]|nr:c-type cytochrome domain-containing protein [Verrucomicrobiae bacterium]
MNKTFLCILVGTTTAAWAGDKLDFSKLDLSKLPPAAEKTGVAYADIQPLLHASCVRCHGAERPKGGLRLDSAQGILKGGKDGPVVVTGDSTKSLLVIAASQIDEKTAMPPKHRPGRGGPRPPGGPGGPDAPGGPAAGGQGGPPQPGAEAGGPPPGFHPGPGGFGPPPKPLTRDQVSLLRAWVDQGAK